METKKNLKKKSADKYEKEIIPLEKWLASFKNNNNRERINPRVLIRQFYAQGYFEAYDIIRNYSEKLGLEIMWFKEKRNCSHYFISKKFPELESICVYCNRIFNESEPIPCVQENCLHIFCSLNCLENHKILMHKDST
ncbi:MAG TPA: hypothetical protein VJU85_01110 [Nitrososphaeraceae archaeon]|nr:hypothetical protein [Nitrososphaeraceae archaeon]